MLEMKKTGATKQMISPPDEGSTILYIACTWAGFRSSNLYASTILEK